MSLFARKPQDPLEAQMRELETRQRQIEREMERLQSEINLFPSNSQPAVPVEVLPPQPESGESAAFRPARSRRLRLGVERRRVRRRVLAILALVFVIALLIYRAAS